MNIRSLKKRDELITQISALQAEQDANPNTSNAKKLKGLHQEFNLINQYRRSLQTNSHHKFQHLNESAHRLIDQVHPSYRPCVQAFEDSLKDLAKQDLSSLGVTPATSEKQWQYRYALALGLLNDYLEFLQNNSPILRSLLKPTFFMGNEGISLEDAIDLTNENNENLFKKATDLNLINFHYLTRKDQYVIAIDKHEAQLKQLAELETELLQLRSHAAIQDSDLVKSVCNYGDRLVHTLKVDVDKTISYRTAEDVIAETRAMINELKNGLNFDTNSEERKNHQHKANQHAFELMKMADKRKNPSSNWWKWALLIASVAILTLGILALNALFSGVFLGISFAATTSMITAAGTTATHLTSAGGLAFLGGLGGTLFGGMATISSACLFFPGNYTKQASQGLVKATQKALAEEKPQPAATVALKPV